MNIDYLKKFASENGFIGAMCTSAKTGEGITEAVACLVRNILIKELATFPPEKIDEYGTFRISSFNKSSRANTQKKKDGCKC